MKKPVNERVQISKKLRNFRMKPELSKDQNIKQERQHLTKFKVTNFWNWIFKNIENRRTEHCCFIRTTLVTIRRANMATTTYKETFLWQEKESQKEKGRITLGAMSSYLSIDKFPRLFKSINRTFHKTTGDLKDRVEIIEITASGCNCNPETNSLCSNFLSFTMNYLVCNHPGYLKTR